MSDPRSRIPSVDSLLSEEPIESLVDVFGRPRVVDAIREAIERVRADVTAAADAGDFATWDAKVADPATYATLATAILEAGDVPSLRRVINGTGVILHTNLGRAPLAAAAVEAMRAAAGEYSNLEFDLAGGVRGSRYVHCVSLLRELTGAEDALVVNNAAGALVLAVNTLARGEGVAVSRGELVEIGGGFRIPEVLERASTRLVEVGSTNRTRLRDYEAALDDEPVAAVLKVHRSNFRITGFTEEATLRELSELTRARSIPLVHDLGSGLMIDAARLGLPEEPLAAESLGAGSDVVVVSGDKLLGGTQAGIVLGRAELMQRMRKNPLCRALRVDKVTLAGLEATLRLYRDPERALREIPTLRMLSEAADDVRDRAEILATRLAESGVSRVVAEGADLAAEAGRVADGPTVDVVPTLGAVGGGTFPGVEIDSWALELTGSTGADALSARLRDGDPPVVGRIVDDRLRIDVRTLLPGQEDDLVRCVAAALE